MRIVILDPTLEVKIQSPTHPKKQNKKIDLQPHILGRNKTDGKQGILEDKWLYHGKKNAKLTLQLNKDNSHGWTWTH